MIIINTQVKEALVMNDFVKIIRCNAKSFEMILDRIKSEDYIKLVNEIILSSYKHKELVEKKMNECGIESEVNNLTDKFNNFLDETKLNMIKGEYRYILIGVDILNRTIKRIYEFLYLNKEDITSYIDNIESTLGDLEKFITKLKKLLSKYY